MYFYNNTITAEENLRGLINDYNRMCASIINNKLSNDGQDVSIKSNVDYVAMMTNVELPEES